MATRGTRLLGARWWYWMLFLLVLIITMLGPIFYSTRITTRTGLAKVECNALSTSLKAYASEYGELPAGTPAEILRVLRGMNQRGIIFFEAAPKNVNERGELQDPWKNRYRIDTTSPGAPRVYSIGRDGIDQRGVERSDDIVSWR